MFLDCFHMFLKSALQATGKSSELQVDKPVVDKLYKVHDDLLKTWDILARLPLALEFRDVVK